MMRFISQVLYFFTDNLKLLRIPSFLILFLFTPLLIFMYGKSIWGLKQRFIISTFTLLTPINLYYSFSLRCYSLITFLSCIAVISLGIFIEKHEREQLKWITITLLLGTYVHYLMAVFGICIFAAAYLAAMSDRKVSRITANYACLYVIGLLPILFGFIIISYVRFHGVSQMIHTGDTYNWFYGSSQSHNSGDSPMSLLMEMSLCGIIPLFLLIPLWRDKTFRYLGIVCLAGTAILTIVSSSHPVYIRYMIPFITTTMICGSYLFVEGKPRFHGKIIFQIVFLLQMIAAIYAGSIFNYRDFSGVVKYFKENDDTNIIYMRDNKYVSHLYYWLNGKILEDRCNGNQPFAGCRPEKFRISAGPYPVLREYLVNEHIEKYYFLEYGDSDRKTNTGDKHGGADASPINCLVATSEKTYKISLCRTAPTVLRGNLGNRGQSPVIKWSKKYVGIK